LNGGTIRDAAANDASLTLPAPGALGSLGFNKAIVIQTVWKVYMPIFIPCTVDGNCSGIVFPRPIDP
jgi:hypothetical protein